MIGSCKKMKLIVGGLVYLKRNIYTNRLEKQFLNMPLPMTCLLLKKKKKRFIFLHQILAEISQCKGFEVEYNYSNFHPYIFECTAGKKRK